MGKENGNGEKVGGRWLERRHLLRLRWLGRGRSWGHLEVLHLLLLLLLLEVLSRAAIFVMLPHPVQVTHDVSGLVSERGASSPTTTTPNL